MVKWASLGEADGKHLHSDGNWYSWPERDGLVRWYERGHCEYCGLPGKLHKAGCPVLVLAYVERLEQRVADLEAELALLKIG